MIQIVLYFEPYRTKNRDEFCDLNSVTWLCYAEDKTMAQQTFKTVGCIFLKVAHKTTLCGIMLVLQHCTQWNSTFYERKTYKNITMFVLDKLPLLLKCKCKINKLGGYKSLVFIITRRDFFLNPFYFIFYVSFFFFYAKKKKTGVGKRKKT